jgi:hypothetical protein
LEVKVEAAGREVVPTEMELEPVEATLAVREAVAVPLRRT